MMNEQKIAKQNFQMNLHPDETHEYNHVTVLLTQWLDTLPPQEFYF